MFKKKLRLKVRRASKRKPSIEQIQGDDLQCDTGKWRNLIQVIDREKNLYHKVITDKETGEIIHECKEPLSQHQGHGDAKGGQLSSHKGRPPITSVSRRLYRKGSKMNKKQFLILIMSVLISSFLGGAFVQFIFHAPAVIAKESLRSSIGTVIKANKFLLTNQKGLIRASLSLESPGLKDEHPALTFFDKDGKSRASFYLGNHDSPEMVFYDKNGTNRFNFGLAPAGNAGLSINSGKFKKLIELDTSSDIPVITIWGENTGMRWAPP